MEKRLGKKFDGHFMEFKNDIKDWFDDNQCTVTGKVNKSEFLKFIYDYNNVELSKEDFQKRKRVKNIVPQYERCCANRANGEQCTRRKKDDSDYCGTHSKGTPHGIISNKVENIQSTKKTLIWAEEIKGICYYIDEQLNVYDFEDIIKNRDNPKVIAQYEKNTIDNATIYSIPQYGI
jgi:hypothetical protein